MGLIGKCLAHDERWCVTRISPYALRPARELDYSVDKWRLVTEKKTDAFGALVGGVRSWLAKLGTTTRVPSSLACAHSRWAALHWCWCCHCCCYCCCCCRCCRLLRYTETEASSRTLRSQFCLQLCTNSARDCTAPVLNIRN